MICKICQKEKLGANFLGVCQDCIINQWEKAKIFVEKTHRVSRKKFNLPEKVPQNKNGLQCKVCANYCRMQEEEFGFCGLRKVKNGKIISFVDTKKALLEYYYDLLPTNCVASPWCEPRPCVQERGEAESGKYNLAVFCGACNFNCLFCQNWRFKDNTSSLFPILDQEELLKAIREDVHCICFFGGDPGPQLPFIIEFCKKARQIRKDVRFCLETNGIEDSKLLEECAKICFGSNGIIKFDLKFFDERLALALSGVSNKKTYENFEILAKLNSKQIVASTLLVPGYVYEKEVFNIAKFIADLDEDIPYALLAFYPCFKFNDLPTTSRKQAEGCLEAAIKAGLKRVRIGNVYLLR